MVLFIWSLNCGTEEPICETDIDHRHREDTQIQTHRHTDTQTHRLTDTEKRFVAAKRKELGRGGLECVATGCQLFYISIHRRENNRVLFYSTVSCDNESHTHTHITESLCSRAEINIVKQLYVNFKNEKVLSSWSSD